MTCEIVSFSDFIAFIRKSSGLSPQAISPMNRKVGNRNTHSRSAICLRLTVPSSALLHSSDSASSWARHGRGRDSARVESRARRAASALRCNAVFLALRRSDEQEALRTATRPGRALNPGRPAGSKCEPLREEAAATSMAATACAAGPRTRRRRIGGNSLDQRARAAPGGPSPAGT